MDHTDVGLRAAIRALTDVVAPAVDPGHAQARDQLRLAVDYLEFVAQRIDQLHQRHRFELKHHLALARSVLDILGGAAQPALASAVAGGANVLDQADASAGTIQRACAELAAAVADTVRDAGSQPASTHRAIERCVLKASQERIAFERAWYLPQRLDPDPHEVLALAAYLPE